MYTHGILITAFAYFLLPNPVLSARHLLQEGVTSGPSSAPKPSTDQACYYSPEHGLCLHVLAVNQSDCSRLSRQAGIAVEVDNNEHCFISYPSDCQALNAGYVRGTGLPMEPCDQELESQIQTNLTTLEKAASERPRYFLFPCACPAFWQQGVFLPC